ncbi:hypothetical protein [Crenothrix polyspora]|uniref:ATP-grasp domain-containing protein n=1 Tax=Crenothrix polyspora TaxID=360316 RepID=A0A1R4HBE3_9GAMM|nr:hypothetical protein [Crenothrix polyspora]SJM93496.1 hypothetical protein CRENPOLYSF1_430137 [Crenothrix polyspora]
MPISVASVPEIYGRFDEICIFIHAVTSVGEISGVNLNDKAAARAMLLMRPKDIIVVSSPIENACLNYFNTLGLTIDPQRIVVVPVASDVPLTEGLVLDASALDRIKALVGNEPVVIDPFMAGKNEINLVVQLKKLLGNRVAYIGANLSVAQRVNRKDIARQLAIESNVPVAPGELISNILTSNGDNLTKEKLREAVQRQMGMTGNVVVKGVVGASGSATFVIKKGMCLDGALQKILDRRDNTEYLVEPLFKISVAPNVTVWIDPDDGAVLLANSTDQRLDENLIFAGSIFPSSARTHREIVGAATRLAKRLYQMGVSGWAGFDFVEYHDALTGEYRFFFSEINARYNGGLYAKALFDVIKSRQRQYNRPIPEAYVTQNIAISPATFYELQTAYSELLFDLETGYGVIGCD